MGLAYSSARTAFSVVPLCVWQRLIRRDVIGLGYHVVSNERLDHIRHLHRYKTPAQFEQDLLWIKSHGRAIGQAELLHSVRTGSKISPRSFHVSFDDGTAQCNSVVLPLLQKHGIPCTFFVTTDLLDNRKLFYRHLVSLCIEGFTAADRSTRKDLIGRIDRTFNQRLRNDKAVILWLKSLYQPHQDQLITLAKWLKTEPDEYLRRHRPYLKVEDVNELSSAGFTIGAHTCSHPNFRLLSDPAAFEREIVESSRIVRDITGQKEVPFSFPFGAAHVKRELLRLVQTRYPFIVPHFSATGVNSQESLLDRIIVDDSGGASEDRSNLPACLHRAYVRCVLESLQRSYRRPKC